MRTKTSAIITGQRMPEVFKKINFKTDYPTPLRMMICTHFKKKNFNFQKEVTPVHHHHNRNKRIILARSSNIMYNSACFSKSKLALFDAEDRQKALGRDYCHLIPTGSAYYETWIASGVVRGFKFKRAFDIG